MADLLTTTTTTHASTVPSTMIGGAATTTRAILQFSTGLLRGKEFELQQTSIVGRKRGVTVCLPPDERRVSAEHAQLRRSPVGTWVLQDLGSKRGVYLNGERIAVGARPIVQAGDTITFGKGGPSAVLSLRSEEFRTEATTRYAITLALTGDTPRRFHFDCRPLISIGRAKECDVRVEPKSELGVSRRHARIRFAARRFSIEDLGSEGGTLVNGERVTTAPLRDGDIIELGPDGPRLVVEATEGTADMGPSEESVVALVDHVATTRSRGMMKWLIGSAVVLLALGAAAWMQLDRGATELDDRVNSLDTKTDSLREIAEAPPPPTDTEVFRKLATRFEPAMLLVYTKFSVKVPSTAGDTVMLEGDTFGSGFLVSTEGHAVTNRHVLQPWIGDLEIAADLVPIVEEFGKDALVIDATTWVWPAGTRAFDERGEIDPSTGFSTDHGLALIGFPPQFLVDAQSADGTEVQLIAHNHADLGLLRLQGYEIDAEHLPRLATADAPPAPLDAVMSLGFPHGRALLERGLAKMSPTIGQVRKVEETLQLSIATYPGNSGGPVLSTDGTIVGVTTRRYGEGLGVAIPADKVVRLVEFLKLPPSLLGS